MKKGLSNFILTGLSFIIVTYILPKMYISGAFSLIVLTLFFGILNSLVKPVLQLLSLPITILSLGLFSFAINAIILKLAFMDCVVLHRKSYRSFYNNNSSSFNLNSKFCFRSNI